LTSDEASRFERDNHLMNGRRSYTEKLSDIGFCGRPSEYQSIGMDKARYWPCLGVKAKRLLADAGFICALNQRGMPMNIRYRVDLTPNVTHSTGC
jgi:hypothetical protein